MEQWTPEEIRARALARDAFLPADLQLGSWPAPVVKSEAPAWEPPAAPVVGVRYWSPVTRSDVSTWMVGG